MKCEYISAFPFHLKRERQGHYFHRANTYINLRLHNFLTTFFGQLRNLKNHA